MKSIDALWLSGGRVEKKQRLSAWTGFGWGVADTILELPAGAADGVEEGEVEGEGAALGGARHAASADRAHRALRQKTRLRRIDVLGRVHTSRSSQFVWNGIAMFTVRVQQAAGHVGGDLQRLLHRATLDHETRQISRGREVLAILDLLDVHSHSERRVHGRSLRAKPNDRAVPPAPGSDGTSRFAS